MYLSSPTSTRSTAIPKSLAFFCNHNPAHCRFSPWRCQGAIWGSSGVDLGKHRGGKPPRTAKLAGDETDLRLFPPLHAGWAPRDEEAPVPISGGNAKRVLFRALNIETGGPLFVLYRQGRGVEFEDFLEELRGHYRGRHVVLLLDEDSSHTAEDSQDTAEERATWLWLASLSVIQPRLPRTLW